MRRNSKEGQANGLDRVPEGIPRRHRRAQSRNRTEEQRNAKEDNDQTLAEEIRRSKEYLEDGPQRSADSETLPTVKR